LLRTDLKMADEMEQQPYLGAPVTLISSLDVRYEGILFTIDPNESTVALQNVKCLGTEDRQSGDKSIPKSDTVYEFIIFRGENIKTICLSEGGEPEEKSPINDPSILKVGPTGKAPTKPSSRSAQMHHANQHQQPQRRYQHHDNRWNQQQRYHHQNNYQQRNRGYGPPGRRYYRYDNRRGRGPQYQYRRNNRYNGRRNQRHRGSEYAPGNAQFLTRNRQDDNVDALKDDFDFAEANARFAKNEFEEQLDEPVAPESEVKEVEKDPENTEKNTTTEEVKDEEASAKKEEEGDEKEEKEVAVENKGDPAKTPAVKFEYKYNPEVSFFDDLDAGSEPRRNRNAKQRREVDTQTFGSIAANYAPRTYRNRYRGRRRYNNRNRY